MELNGHYYKAPNSIYEYTTNVRQLAVLHYLLRCQNTDTGTSFPSYQNIASNCHMARRSVIKTVQELIDLNLITIEPKPYKANVYIVHIPQEPKVVQEMHQCITDTSAGDAPTSAGDAPLLVQEMHPNNTKRTRLIKKTKDKSNKFSNKIKIDDKDYQQLVDTWGKIKVDNMIEELNNNMTDKWISPELHLTAIRKGLKNERGW